MAQMILRVPIHVDGLYVETAALELGLPMADFSKLPYNRSDGSSVNSDFPNLAERAFYAPGDDYLPKGIPPVQRLRFDRLGEDVLLCLFAGEIQTIDIHEHAETIHFGVDSGNDPNITADYRKKLRDLTSKELGKGIELPWKSTDKRTLDILDLPRRAAPLTTPQPSASR